MGNKFKRLIMFLIIVLGMGLFASEEKKAPNEIIKDNPEREVTTVESMKVRDHATMSLSVTKKNEKVIEGELIGDKLKVQLPVKGISENTLDRMAKPKDGKKLVVESMSKISPRMANKSIKRMPTQEEMNNLTAEQIQAMMNDTTDKKEESTQNKTIKNHIAVENDEGIDVEILDVNKNEDIYVNVEENGQVVDRYRVAARATVPSSRILETKGYPLKDVYLRNTVIQLGNKKMWIGAKDYKSYSVNISEMQGARFEFSPKTIKLDDDFFKNQSINIDLKQPSILGVGFKLQSNYTGTDRAPLFKRLTGSKNEGIGEFLSSATEGLYYSVYKDGTLYLAKHAYNAGRSGINSFKYIEFVEKDRSGNILTDYLSKGTIKGIAYEIEFYLEGGTTHPGVYKTVGTMNTSVWQNGGGSAILKLENALINVGDKEGAFGVKITEDNLIKKSDVTLDSSEPEVWRVLDNKDIKLSFMKSNDDPKNYSDVGLFINGEIDRQIARYYQGKEANVHTIKYTQGNKEQVFKIRVSQEAEKYAKVEISPVTLQNPDDINVKPKVQFDIVQGKKIDNGLTEFRRARYIVTFPRIEEIDDKIDITLTVDPRVAYTTKATDVPGQVSWMTLSKKYGKWNDSDKTDLSEMISVDKVYDDPNLTVSEVVSVEGESKETGDSDYDRFKKQNANSEERLDIAFKRGVTFTQLSQNSNLMISPLRNVAYKILYKASDTKKYRSTITVNYAKPEGSDTFKDEIGYYGVGSVNISGKDIGEYTILHKDSLASNSNEKPLNTHVGNLPTFNGLLDGQKDKQIVTRYRIKVDTETDFKDFEDIGTKININDNLAITLSKTNEVSNKKSIKVHKKTDNTFNHTILIEYYCKDIKLGEYTLTVNNTNTPNDLGEASVKLDARIAQVGDKYSRIRLRDKQLFSFNSRNDTDDNDHIEVYSDFIGDITNFNKASNLTKYDAVNIDDNVTVKINSGTNSDDNITDKTHDNQKYKVNRSGENEGGIPVDIIFSNFRDINNHIISKWKVYGTTHNGNNDFEMTTTNGIKFTGDIKEKYIRQEDGATGHATSIDSKESTVYKGAGTLNLVRAKVGHTYTFTAGSNGNVTANGPSSGRNITLVRDSGYSLDARGLFSNGKSIANRMIIKNNSNQLARVDGTVGDTLESDNLTIEDATVKIGINNSGQLTVTKVTDGNIDSTTLTIEYYHIKDSNKEVDFNANDNKNIHLGTYTLTLKNPIVGDYDTNKVIVYIDKRFTLIDTYNWLLKTGENITATKPSGITSNSESKFLDFFKFEGELDISSLNGNIELGLDVEDREYMFRASNVYDVFLTGKDVWENETAIPINIDISQLNSNLIVSKFNGSSPILDNKFSLVFTDNNTEKIYKGNIEEVIVGEGVRSGIGTIDTFNMEQNIEYKFQTILGKGNIIISNEPKIRIIADSISENPVDTRGVVEGTTDKNVANKIKVTFDRESTPRITSNLINGITNEGLKVAINTTDTDINSLGGLILTKTADNITATEVKVEYFYDIDNTNNISSNAIKLGEFTLTINDVNPITNLGTLTTTIDPRLLNLKNSKGDKVAEKEWLTLDRYSDSNLDSLKPNEYTGLIEENIDGSLNSAELTEILNVSKGNIKYDVITGGSSKYTRFGTKNGSDSMPYVAIKLVNGGSLNTSNLITDQNFARKVSDIGEVTIEAEDGNNKKYSFIHDLETVTKPTENSYDSEKGYIGTGTIDLSNIPVSQEFYTIVSSASTPADDMEIILENGSTGTLPKLTGLVSGYTNQSIASYYTVTIGSGNVTEGLNAETDIVANQVKIRLKDTGELELLKLTDETIPSTTITIRYYHKSGIQLGEYVLTISNDTSATTNGTITTKVDPRFVQIDEAGYNSYWLTTENITGSNLTNNILTINMDGIIKTSSTATSSVINKVIEVKNSSNGVYEKVSGEVNGYTKYYIGNETSGQNFAVKLGENILTGGTIARKYSDNTNGNLTIKYVDGSAKKSFVHKFELITSPGTNFTPEAGYSGEGTVDLYGKGDNTYTLVMPSTGARATTTTEELVLEDGAKGHLPVLTGLIDTDKLLATHYKVTVDGNEKTVTPIDQKIELETGKLALKFDTTNMKTQLVKIGNGNITIQSVKIEYYYYADKDTTKQAIKLGKFDLTIEDKKPIESGNITFTIDPRLRQITSITDSNVTWLTPSGMYGPWNSASKGDYTGFLHLNNGVTGTESVNIERVENRKNGVTSGEYIVFKNKKPSSYNDIAFKSNLALNAYGTSDNIMVSPYEDEKFDAIFIDDDGNRYQVNIEVQGHTGVVDQDGYNGSGTLDMSAGKLNTVYEFSAPTSNSDDIQDSTDTLTMTDISQFPNVMGVVEDQTGTVLANEIEVKVGKGTPITGSQENTATAIGNKKYVVNNDLEIELTTDNKLMIKKLKDEFNYTASGQEIIITYKHTKDGFADITLGKFTLKVKSDITDLGIYTLTVDGRMLAKGVKAGYWIVVDGTMSGSSGTEPTNTNYSQMFKKEEFTNSIFNSKTEIKANDIWVVPERDRYTSSKGWLNDGVNRIAFKDNTAIVISLPLGSLDEFQNKLIVNSGGADGYKRNPYTFVFIADGGKYRGTAKIVGDTDFVKTTGTATLNLTGIPKNTSDTWASKSTGGQGTSGKMILTFTQNQLFDMGTVNNRAQVTNKFTYKVGNASRDTLVNATSGEIDLNGNQTKDIKISFVEEGLQITKLTNEIINDVQVTITPKYNDIVLGVLNLTVTNTATSLGDITVEVDRRLAGVTNAHWVGVDGKLYNSTGMYGEYSGLVGATIENSSTTNVATHNVTDIETINDKTILDSYKGNRGTYKHWTDTTDRKNKLALPYGDGVTLGSYGVEANSLLVVSKEDLVTTRTQRSATDEINHTFTLTATDSTQTSVDNLYKGTIIERYVGTGAYSGSGNIDLANSESGSTYTFGTSKTNNTVTGTGNGGGSLTITNVVGDPVNTLGLVTGKTNQNIANKLEVKFTDYNGNETTPNPATSTSLSVAHDNLTVGIDTVTGGLTLRRDGSSGVREVEVNYYYTPTNGVQEILLGTFTLTIKNVLELGDVTVDVDSRLLQIADNTSWIRLGSGKVSNLKGDVSAGEYPLFIKPSEAFNLGSNTIFNDYTVSSITKINGITSISSMGDSESITYYYTNNNGAKNEAAFPINIPLSTFIKTDTNSKLVISKYSYGDTAHTEENDFIATAQKDTKAINIKGNILETYNTPAIKDSGYTGTGSINLVRATLGTAYTFAPGLTQTTTVSGITLNVDNGGRSVNAKGLVKNTNESIANLMEITVNGATSAIRVTGTAGQAFEKTGIKVGDAEITLGITAEGGFKIAKTKEGNINNIPVKIDYYFSPDPSATTPKKVKLGTFTLTINNPVIDGGEAEVEIDERFARFERYNWLFRNNGTGQTATDMTTNNITKYNYFTDFFKYGSKKLNVDGINGTITEALRVEGREHRNNDKPDKPYVSFNIESTGWKGEAAVPQDGDIANINELMVVSKGNIDLDDEISVNNKFALVFEENNIEKIYTGNIKEKIVKTGGYYTGSGKLNILNTNKNDEYNFGLELVDNNIASNDTKVSITSATGKPVNTLGVVEGTKDKIVANRIQVTFKDKDGNELAKKLNNSTELSVSYGGLTIGITTTGNNKGGLSLTRTQEKAEDINIKKVFIEYFYDATPEDETINTNGDAIKLGEFTLTIEKPEFEIIGNNILDFGTMIKGYPTTVSNYFKIKNLSNKQVEFSVAQDGIMTFEGKHLNNENHNITNIPKEEQLEVKNISVRKFNDYIFHLIATADPKENNKEGDYKGEIQVIVTITNP